MLYIIKKLFISLLFIVIFFAGKYIVDYVYLDQTLIYLNLRTN